MRLHCLRTCHALLRKWSAGVFLLAAGLLALPAASAPSAVVVTPQVRAELLAHAPAGAAAGQPLWLGLRIEHKKHWHTYWKNPGDSGLPTTLEWTLPAGVTAGDIAWPTPKKLPVGPLMNFGYEDTLLLAVPVTVPAGHSGRTLEVQLRADWLVCKEVCIPEGGDFVLSVPLDGGVPGGADAAATATLFAASRQREPQSLQAGQAQAAVQDGALVVRVAGLPAAWQGRELAFFPETAGVIANAEVPQARWEGAVWQARIALDPQRSEAPTTIPAVLVPAGEAAGALVAVAVTSAWPAATSTTTAPGADALPALGAGTVDSSAGAEAPVNTAPPIGLAAALLLALAGGALLNLMPCVFPILSLKVLGFASHGRDRRKVLAGGLAYTAGVVISFVALAALLLALRAGGEQLGWGFQLQSPVVVATLAALFTLIGLNLAGVFEFGSVLPSSWAAARARHPLVDSLLTGVLAVAVASPCTAPFMGVSLGLAVTLPTVQALAVFAALGLGMALPYLAVSAWPALARAMPRPGVWMQHFKVLMAFPMFATVVWLVWVLGQQAGIDGAAALLGLLVALAFAAWALGAPALGSKARLGFGSAAAVVLALAVAWVAPALKADAVAAVPATAGTDARWQAWSPERVAAARAEGRPVFVDFTAAWCVTCQFNKRTTLADAAVLQDFDTRRVLLLRADWTRRDAVITAELTKLGRSGVPVYALYAPGNAGPRVLSEILSVAEVRDALATLPQQTAAR